MKNLIQKLSNFYHHKDIGFNRSTHHSSIKAPFFHLSMYPKRFSAILFIIFSALLLVSADDSPPIPASDATKDELSSAFFDRLETPSSPKSITFDLFTPELDTAFTSADGKTAVLWLALRDDYGRLLATEPGLALAKQTEEGWQILLPGDPDWDEAFTSLPKGFLPLEHSPAPKNLPDDATSVKGPLSGYYLPYAAGTKHWLEGSISHFQYIPELGYPSCTAEFCRYAYDFTDSWLFPLLASKSGTVYAFRDSCPNGNTACTNYIVLYNATDQTYQIYLHLAYNTIPDKLTKGAAVQRGQYIGDIDDTGYSTSQHVHFMVTNSVWVGGDGYYWGRSIDIRFADVAINNGIPRTCYEVTNFPIYDGATECLGNKADPRNPANDWYVSGNIGAFPPTGTLTRPAANEIVNAGLNQLIDVTATASDDVRVKALSLVAKVNGQWVEIGPKVTPSTTLSQYDWDVDLCKAGPFNGALEVALRVWDYEGNVTSALSPRTILVDHACPPPTSQLTSTTDFDSTAVLLNWDASSKGAGLGSFELQWRIEPGTWDPANTITIAGNQRSTWFAGQPGSTYAFRLRALDINGQPEAWPANDAAEIFATLPATCTADTFEPDDVSLDAKELSFGQQAQRNLCGVADPDWFRVQFVEENDYMVRVASLNGGAAVKISVYADNGVTLLASTQSPGIGQNAQVIFPAMAGFYRIKVEPLVPNLMGTNAIYGITVSEGHVVYLPVVKR
ncbi:MAG: peptidoglycan DD-metalloendopeptidase family protein [Anaerolineaceae bacterium]|nr:peptidoglycan DD-metalloendopeptidase family protein [Anaerolineaceae bacterium]